MNLKPYLPLLKKIATASFNFGRKVGELCAESSKMEEVFQSVMDGTIDPGDKEDATKRMSDFLKGLDEYKAMMDVNRSNRAKLAKLYSELATASVPEYDEYTEAQQNLAIETAIDLVLKTLKAKGIVEDNR